MNKLSMDIYCAIHSVLNMLQLLLILFSFIYVSKLRSYKLKNITNGGEDRNTSLGRILQKITSVLRSSAILGQGPMYSVLAPKSVPRLLVTQYTIYGIFLNLVMF